VIKVTTLDGRTIYINSTCIESFTKHSGVDTIIQIRGGKTYLVSETPEELLALIGDHIRSYLVYQGVGVVSYVEAL
jgi:uncharacterized protein YlzI (FlbEa/FlbD family)